MNLRLSSDSVHPSSEEGAGHMREISSSMAAILLQSVGTHTHKDEGSETV